MSGYDILNEAIKALSGFDWINRVDWRMAARFVRVEYSNGIVVDMYPATGDAVIISGATKSMHPSNIKGMLFGGVGDSQYEFKNSRGLVEFLTSVKDE